MTFDPTSTDDLRAWFRDFHPRTRPDFMVQDPDGTVRPITNVEMSRYTMAAHVLRDDLLRAADIERFLFGASEHDK